MDANGFASVGELNFGDIDLGDRRRNKRLVDSVNKMCMHPGGTLPDKLNSPQDLRAFYRLVNVPEVTHPKLIEAHARQTRREIAATTGTVLVLHDQTELDYTTRRKLSERMGQIGKGSRRGYICHNSLAVVADTGETLGLLSQILHHRATVPAGESTKSRRERKSRESRLWVKGVEAAGPAPAGKLVVDVSDTLSDTFEYMAHELTHGRHFVIRCRENRKLAEPLAGRDYLFDGARHLAATATSVVAVQGSAKQPARMAKVNVAFSSVTIPPPKRKTGDYAKRPLSLWVVRVWEPQPPPNAEPLEWFLLGDLPIDDDRPALTYKHWYELRWVVEEFHKAKKTGCGVESLQFDTLGALEPAIAVISVVAAKLLRLRDAARQPNADTRPATEVVDPIYVDTLHAYYGDRLGCNPSVLKFYMLVARLGGHQNRKCDGLPGWITLWRGWMKLEQQVRGFEHGRRWNTIHKRCGKT